MCGIRTLSIRGQPNYIPKKEMSMIEFFFFFVIGCGTGALYVLGCQKILARMDQRNEYIERKQ
jgi:hypothetical protein